MAYNSYADAERALKAIVQKVGSIAPEDGFRRNVYFVMHTAFEMSFHNRATKGEDVLFGGDASYERGTQGDVDSMLGVLDDTILFAREFRDYMASDRCAQKLTELERMLSVLVKNGGGNVERYRQANRRPGSPARPFFEFEAHAPERDTEIM